MGPLNEENDFLADEMERKPGVPFVRLEVSFEEAAVVTDCKVHVFSRVVHVVKHQKFFCGRLVSSNYQDLDFDVPLVDQQMCAQCTKAYAAGAGSSDQEGG